MGGTREGRGFGCEEPLLSGRGAAPWSPGAEEGTTDATALGIALAGAFNADGVAVRATSADDDVKREAGRTLVHLAELRQKI